MLNSCVVSLASVSSWLQHNFGVLEEECCACKRPPAITNGSPVCRKHPQAACQLIFVLIYYFSAYSWGLSVKYSWRCYKMKNPPLCSSQLYSVAHSQNDTLLLWTNVWRAALPNYGIPCQFISISNVSVWFISRTGVCIWHWSGNEVTLSEGGWLRLN